MKPGRGKFIGRRGGLARQGEESKQTIALFSYGNKERKEWEKQRGGVTGWEG